MSHDQGCSSTCLGGHYFAKIKGEAMTHLCPPECAAFGCHEQAVTHCLRPGEWFEGFYCAVHATSEVPS